MDAAAWANAIDTVRHHVVRIKTPAGYGTGFLLALSEDKEHVGVATAKHVIDYADEWQQPIKVEHLPSGTAVLLSPNDRQVHLKQRMDSACMFFQKRTLQLPASTVPLPRPPAPGTIPHVRQGVEVGWCGYPIVCPDHLCFFSGRISAWLGAEASYLVDGPAIRGVSGGPAFSGGESGPTLMGLLTEYRGAAEPSAGLSVIRSITPYLSLFQGLKAASSGGATETSGNAR